MSKASDLELLRDLAGASETEREEKLRALGPTSPQRNRALLQALGRGGERARNERHLSALLKGSEDRGDDERNARRRSRRHVGLTNEAGEEMLASSARDPATDAEMQQETAAAIRAICPSELEHRVLELREAGLTVREIAESIDIPKTTAHDRIQRMRQRAELPAEPPILWSGATARQGGDDEREPSWIDQDIGSYLRSGGVRFQQWERRPRRVSPASTAAEDQSIDEAIEAIEERRKYPEPRYLCDGSGGMMLDQIGKDDQEDEEEEVPKKRATRAETAKLKAALLQHVETLLANIDERMARWRERCEAQQPADVQLLKAPERRDAA